MMTAASFKLPTNAARAGRRAEDDDEHTLELIEELQPRRARRGDGQDIGAKAGQAFFGLLLR